MKNLKHDMKIYVFILISLYFLNPVSYSKDISWPSKIHYKYTRVNGKNIFYRESGNAEKQTILLLHGFPSSSHTYRELIPLLSGEYHIVAPDYLGSGYSDHPDPDKQRYTFDLLSEYVYGLTGKLELKKYVIYMQDFGAPVGFRVMIKDPDRVEGIIVQNANAYLDGLTEKRREFFKSANKDHSPEKINELYNIVSRNSVIHKQYLRDVAGREDLISPDSWTNDLVFLQSDKDKKIQVQLFQDYYNNILAYPKWQKFLREHKLPALIIWGKNDPAFITAGARAYLNDLPDAELHLLDAGHFAVEEDPVQIAKYILKFMHELTQNQD